MKDLTRRNGEEAFRLRMQAQCDQIDQYRLRVLREQQRRLSRDEAALEWIERYADSFHWRSPVHEDGRTTTTVP